MLKTQESKSPRTACVPAFSSYGVGIQLSSMWGCLPLNLNKLCYEFSLAWSLAVEVKFTEEVSGFR